MVAEAAAATAVVAQRGLLCAAAADASRSRLLISLDHTKQTYPFGGRGVRSIDVFGEVLLEILE